MNKFAILNIHFSFGDISGEIYPVLIGDENNLLLVDCAYTSYLPKLQAEAAANGLDLARLTHIVITHHDHDHMGALLELKTAYPNVKILSSAIQAGYIDGSKKSLRLIQAENIYSSLSDAEKQGALQFQQVLRAVRPAAVDAVLRPGEVLPIAGGIKVIPTDGHMPGHISLFLQESGTLIAGDALAAKSGQLCVANPEYTLDMPQALRSIQSLLQYDIKKVICYHGGVVEGNIKESLTRIIEENK